jgi:hypothetical protein
MDVEEGKAGMTFFCPEATRSVNVVGGCVCGWLEAMVCQTPGNGGGGPGPWLACPPRELRVPLPRASIAPGLGASGSPKSQWRHPSPLTLSASSAYCSIWGFSLVYLCGFVADQASRVDWPLTKPQDKVEQKKESFAVACRSCDPSIRAFNSNMRNTYPGCSETH